MSRIADIMAQAQRILDSLKRNDPSADLHDKGTDRVLRDIGVEPEPILRESVRLTKELWPEREEPERFDEFTGPFADESGASAGAGGGQ